MTSGDCRLIFPRALCRGNLYIVTCVANCTVGTAGDCVVVRSPCQIYQRFLGCLGQLVAVRCGGRLVANPISSPALLSRSVVLASLACADTTFALLPLLHGRCHATSLIALPITPDPSARRRVAIGPSLYDL